MQIYLVLLVVQRQPLTINPSAHSLQHDPVASLHSVQLDIGHNDTEMVKK